MNLNIDKIIIVIIAFICGFLLNGMVQGYLIEGDQKACDPFIKSHCEKEAKEPKNCNNDCSSYLKKFGYLPETRVCANDDEEVKGIQTFCEGHFAGQSALLTEVDESKATKGTYYTTTIDGGTYYLRIDNEVKAMTANDKPGSPNVYWSSTPGKGEPIIWDNSKSVGCLTITNINGKKYSLIGYIEAHPEQKVPKWIEFSDFGDNLLEGSYPINITQYSDPGSIKLLSNKENSHWGLGSDNIRKTKRNENEITYGTIWTKKDKDKADVHQKELPAKHVDTPDELLAKKHAEDEADDVSGIETEDIQGPDALKKFVEKTTSISGFSCNSNAGKMQRMCCDTNALCPTPGKKIKGSCSIQFLPFYENCIKTQPFSKFSGPAQCKAMGDLKNKCLRQILNSLKNSVNYEPVKAFQDFWNSSTDYKNLMLFLNKGDFLYDHYSYKDEKENNYKKSDNNWIPLTPKEQVLSPTYNTTIPLLKIYINIQFIRIQFKEKEAKEKKERG